MQKAWAVDDLVVNDDHGRRQFFDGMQQLRLVRGLRPDVGQDVGLFFTCSAQLGRLLVCLVQGVVQEPVGDPVQGSGDVEHQAKGDCSGQE